MAEKFGVSKSVVNNYMRKNGLAVPHDIKVGFRAKAMTGKTTFTPAEDQVIRDNYLTMPVKTLAAKIGRSFTGIMGRLKAMGLEIPEQIRVERKAIGMIKTGHVSFNKGKKQTEYMSKAAIKKTLATRFKKGQLPHNAVGFKNGDISIRQCHPRTGGKSYKWIRVGLGKWELFHLHIWQKKNGKLPKGHCLWFKDGDSMNCTLKNLELITRAENMKRNTIHNYPKELVQVTQLRGALNRQINKHIKKLSA